MSASIELKSIVKAYGAVEVVHGIDLDIAPGEFTVFVGPSGCGKSTLLRMIAGLEPISDGKLLIDGAVMNEVPAAQRGIAMVFQSYALYPHMSVYQNLAFGLETAKVPKAIIKEKVQRAAEILQIEPLLDRKPKQLSGGQRQRVAIGRAITREPRIFLFDEPLSNLDAELRVQMRVEIAKLHRDLGNTMIYVTHDQVEAMTMADKIVVLRLGHIEQVGTPLELYNNPANRFVAGFIGSPKMNFLDATVERVSAEGTGLSHGGGSIVIPRRIAASEGEKITLGIRPEHLSIGTSGEVTLGEVTSELVESLGSQTVVYSRSEGGEPLTVVLEGQQSPAHGARITVSAEARHYHAFSSDGRTI